MEEHFSLACTRERKKVEAVGSQRIGEGIVPLSSFSHHITYWHGNSIEGSEGLRSANNFFFAPSSHPSPPYKKFSYVTERYIVTPLKGKARLEIQSVGAKFSPVCPQYVKHRERSPRWNAANPSIEEAPGTHVRPSDCAPSSLAA